MTSIRRTLLPFSGRSSENGTNNQFSVQSPVPKLIFSGRPTLSPVRRFIAGIFVQKQQHTRKSSYFCWKKSILRCLLFFFLGFLFGMGPFSNDLKHSDLSFEMKPPPVVTVEHSASDVALKKPKETDISVDTVEFAGSSSSRRYDIIRNSDDIPRKQLIVVTPTYNRALQAYYLNRLGQVLRLVKPQVLWIVVELNSASTETADILKNMGIMYRHLLCTKNATDVKDRGAYQRNTALEHIERHRLDGIVHFADDDNIYSLELFERLREVSRFGTWPVGMLAQSKNKPMLEGPVCNGSQVIGWHTNEKSKRLCRFHVDMSGFAFNSTILWDPKRWHRPTSDPIRQLDMVKEDLQDMTFIEQIVEDESQMESVPLGGCSKIMNWHLHLEAHRVVYPRGWILEKNLDAVLPSK